MTAGGPADDCFAYDGRRMPVDEALSELARRVSPVVATERVSLAKAAGRILAEAIVSDRDVPAADNSAVDGYAVRHAELAETAPTTLPIGGQSAAGSAPLANLPAATAVRILTGAALPEGFDSIVMQEDVQRSGDGSQVTVPAGVQQGANRRRAGEAVQTGQVALPAGQRLRPQDLSLAAAVGRANLLVYAPVRVALVSTGDELVGPETAPQTGQVVDSNRPMLRGLLEQTGAAVTDLGVLPDDGALIRQRLGEAATCHDVILTTGGASTGDSDHLVASLRSLGSLHSWQVAIKPGRPIALGQIGATTVAALPGNPVAAFVCFLMFTFPALLRLGGGPWWRPPRLPVPATFEMRKKPGRTEWLRGGLTTDDSGVSQVDIFRQTGSGRLQSLTWADGLVELASETTAVTPGEPVSFIPFSAFGIPSRLVPGLPYWP